MSLAALAMEAAKATPWSVLEGWLAQVRLGQDADLPKDHMEIVRPAPSFPRDAQPPPQP